MSFFVNLLDVIYPINSVYLSFSNDSPAESVGGTWEQIEDRFLYLTTTSNVTGGANSITLTVDQMPSHRHNRNSRIDWYNDTGGGPSSSWSSSSNMVVDKQNTYTQYTGGGKPFNNMPAYITLYGWKRTA